MCLLPSAVYSMDESVTLLGAAASCSYFTEFCKCSLEKAAKQFDHVGKFIHAVHH